MLRKAGWVGRPCPYPGGRLDLSLLSPVMGDCGKSLQRSREAVVLRYSQGAWRRATPSLHIISVVLQTGIGTAQASLTQTSEIHDISPSRCVCVFVYRWDRDREEFLV